MDDATTQPEVARFVTALGKAAAPDSAWQALHHLFAARVGAKLFTVTTVDLKHAEARRLYTNDPNNYPVSGAKPIEIDPWYQLVIVRQQTFVANTLPEIAKHFFDHELIGSLGCGSAINLPVIFAGDVVATINCLDVAGHYGTERVAHAETLALPALAAYLVAERLG